MYPVVIPASAIQRFKYWDSIVREGMFFQNEIYTLINKFPPKKRFIAYEQGCELTGENARICITVDNHGYLLWKSLRD